jgi:hypothetical protein
LKPTPTPKFQIAGAGFKPARRLCQGPPYPSARNANAVLNDSRACTRSHQAPTRGRLTDPDARSMATSGRGSGMVAYNVQTAVDIKHHLIVAHEVTKAAVGTDSLDVVADRGYFKSKEILACDRAGITVTLPRTAPYRQSPERFYTVWTPVGKDRIGEM